MQFISDELEKQMRNIMGIVLKRRDNANIVKIIYGGLINIILNKQDVTESLKFLDECLNKLANGEYPLEELIVKSVCPCLPILKSSSEATVEFPFAVKQLHYEYVSAAKTGRR